jgi:hypothetical protein
MSNADLIFVERSRTRRKHLAPHSGGGSTSTGLPPLNSSGCAFIAVSIFLFHPARTTDLTMMKSSLFLLAALLAMMRMQQGAAFTVVSQQPGSSSTRLWAGDYVPLEGEGKINLKVRGFISWAFKEAGIKLMGSSVTFVGWRCKTCVVERAWPVPQYGFRYPIGTTDEVEMCHVKIHFLPMLCVVRHRWISRVRRVRTRNGSDSAVRSLLGGLLHCID